ncbi:transposase [Legionella drancourtii]
MPRYLFNFYINYIKLNKPNKKIVMIIDNGSIHRSKKVSKFVKKHEWVELFFLPPYHLNIIQLSYFGSG